MKKFREKLTTQIITCQRCSQRLRLPIKPGKTLRVECRGCGLNFDISFKNPIYEIFYFNPKLGIKDNLKASVSRYTQLPQKVRLRLMIIFWLISFLGLALLGLLVYALQLES